MNSIPSTTSLIKRRAWLKTGALTIAACSLRAAESKPATLFTAMGISSSLEHAEKIRAAGGEFLTLTTDSLLMPDQDDAAFAKQLALARKSPLPVLACNGFIRPPHLKCVGPDANHEEVLKWADTAFRRLGEAGGKFIVFGSAGTRRIPKGWARDKAESQLIEVLTRMGELAAKYKITVAVEQLQEKECNFINHIGQAASIIRAVKNPHIRVLADLYHMRVMGDTPEDLAKALDVVAHCEIAEKEERSYPGIHGDDFRPFFRVLHQRGWKGAISIEGRGGQDQLATAFRTIAEQSTFG